MISVIIPVYNAARTLFNCLDSIFNLDYTDFEVIIVNDCSTDNSLDIAKQYNVKIINHEKNFGPGVARNNGAKIANGSILAFTDSDCEVPRDWLRKNEDWRLAFKLPKQYKIYWHKENGVAHNYRATFKSYFKQQIYWVSTTIMVYLLYPHILIKSA